MEYKGFTEYSDRDFDALDLALRAAGSRGVKLGDLDVQQADWDRLHKTRSAVVKGAKTLLDSIKDNDDEIAVRKAEGAHDCLMAALDYIDGEMDRRKAHGQTEPLSYQQRGVPVGESISVSGSTGETIGKSREARWIDTRGQEVRVYSTGENIAERGREGPALGDMARAMLFGPRDDQERRALSEGTDSAGGYTVPTRLASEFIDKLRAATVVFQAGARIVPLDSDNLAIARVTGDPTVAWTAENAEISASDPTFDAVTLAPKKLATLVKCSRELLEDSVNIGPILEQVIIQALSVELDRALMFGSGSSNQPTGLFNISGINSVSMGTNGAVPSNYDDLIDLLYEVQVDNGMDPKVLIMHPRTRKTYAKLKDVNNNPLVEPEMTRALSRLVTTAVPVNQTQGTSNDCSTVLTGDFSKMLVGVRRSIELRRLDQRYAEFDQVGFIATLRADVAVENPVHFAKLIGVRP